MGDSTDLEKAANDLEHAIWLKCAFISAVPKINELIKWHLNKYAESECKKIAQ